MFDMFGTIIKNLCKKPATRRYPFEVRESFKNTRGSIDVNIEDCIFCGICSKKCPSDAIVVDRNEKTWQVDKYKCVICGLCCEVCPKKCINLNEFYAAPTSEKSKKKSTQMPKE